MKKILFYTLLIVLFVNCKKVEAQKDPIEGTWIPKYVYAKGDLEPIEKLILDCHNVIVEWNGSFGNTHFFFR